MGDYHFNLPPYWEIKHTNKVMLVRVLLAKGLKWL